MPNLDFFSNARETVLFGIHEAPGTPISPWGTQPSRCRRGTLYTHTLPCIQLIILGTLYIRVCQNCCISQRTEFRI